MPHSGIAISPELRSQLRRALDAALPGECCGVLLGSSELGRLDVRRVLSTLNASTPTGTFSIPDHEMRRVLFLAAQLREPIVAVFHSHPDGWGDLSELDRIALAYSEWPWVVVTPAERPSDVELRLHDISRSEHDSR